jgi:Ca2+-transporting ATPase
MDFHKLEAVEVLRGVGGSREGLSAEEAAKRLASDGANSLSADKKKSLIKRILAQLANPMIIILLAAAAVSGFFDEIVDMLIIFAVVGVNTIIGVTQEGRAEKAIAKLKKMSVAYARVRRGGQVLHLPAAELVKGDIVQVSAGDIVPADLRILDCAMLKAEEAALTGESLPVEKYSEITLGAGSLGDRKNMLYSSSKILAGTGEGVVVATGMNTEVGKIAAVLNKTAAGKTPLQRKMQEISKVLTIIVLLVCGVIFGVGLLWNKEQPVELFVRAISIAVAAIPEGLAAVVTLVLALGVQRMSKRNAVIRKINACETLGCVQYICTDKTGTLTQNKMTVTEVYQRTVHSAQCTVSGQNKFLDALVLCNNAIVTVDGVSGDPTETALIDYARKKGYAAPNMKRLAELPFDSDRKQMSVVCRADSGDFLFSKGAADSLLNTCTYELINGAEVPLTESRRAEIKAAEKRMAGKALRVLAASYRKVGPHERITVETGERDLVFLGLAGMIARTRRLR